MKRHAKTEGKYLVTTLGSGVTLLYSQATQKLTQEDCLSPLVQDQPGQYSET